MILIYTPNITARVVYTFELVFGSVLNTAYTLTNNLQEFNQSHNYKIAYSQNVITNCVFIKADNLLFETDIKQILPKPNAVYLNFPVLFKADSHSFLPYDLFAMTFYIATRYEEYINDDVDKHLRFKAENSIAYQTNNLSQPILSSLINDFGIKLKQQFSQLIINKRAYNFVSTIDIDNAFAYAHKGFKRNAGGLIKDALALNLTAIENRIKSNLNDKIDPYNTFNIINKLSTETNTALQYFVLIGNYSAYDKNPNYKNKGFVNLLTSLASNYTLGLHPSYQTYNNLENIGIEKRRLENCIEKKVTSARCHFLRIKLPDTYRELIKVGITDDYTMIYASQCGFRTGLCVPYKWFDLEKNEATSLTIHTSVVMEGILRDYKKLEVSDADIELNKLITEVKNNNGEFVSIFHNDSFTTENKQWIDLYKAMLVNASANQSLL